MPAKTVPCSISGCDKKFARIEDMAQHREDLHSERDPTASGNQTSEKPATAKKDVPCTIPECPKLFACVTDMQQHLESKSKSHRKINKSRRQVRDHKPKSTEVFKNSPPEGEFRPIPEPERPNQSVPGTIGETIGCKSSHEIYSSARELGHPKTSIKMNEQRRKQASNPKVVCKGRLRKGKWGCGKKFSSSLTLAQHLRSPKGLKCIQPLYDQESPKNGLEVPFTRQRFPQALLARFPELEHLDPIQDFNFEKGDMGRTPDSETTIAHLFNPVAVPQDKPSRPSNLDTRPSPAPTQTQPARQKTPEPTKNFSSKKDKGVIKSENSENLEESREMHGGSTGSSLLPSPLHMGESQREVTARSMNDLTAMLEKSLAIRTRGSGSCQASGYSPSTDSTNKKSAGPSYERKRSANDSGDSSNSGDDQGKKRPKNTALGRSFLSKERRFACPYYRRNPEKHQEFRSCAGPGFLTVLRVKRPQVCEIQDTELPEGLTKKQGEALRQRKKPSKSGEPSRSDEDQWRDVYKILFPQDSEDVIPSPFYENTHENYSFYQEEQLGDLQRLMCDMLPRMVQRDLEGRAAFVDIPFGSPLPDLITNSIREAVSQTFSHYSQRQETHVATEFDSGIGADGDPLLQDFSMIDFSSFTQEMEHYETAGCVSGDSFESSETNLWIERPDIDPNSSDSGNSRMDDQIFRDFMDFGPYE
ncbi:hypothetical protein FDECE_13572 [Fusarium decemcellulare]|nr:hypothetical protein FDECE_13572 [Fusarium decemcellulare]